MNFIKINRSNVVAALFIVGVTFSCLVPHKACAQQTPVTTTSELKRLFSVAAMPAYFPESEVHQTSSYDRTGGNNDGFEGTYSYLYKNADSNLVVLDVKGKGVLERIWTPTPTDDTLDFYFDGSATPSYSIKYRDLFSGNVYPFVSPVVGHKVGGFYSYLPIPFNNGCKIVFKGKKILFHQFQYRKLNSRYQVETFNPAFTPEAKVQLQKIVSLWNSPIVSVSDFYTGIVRTIEVSKKLLPGQTATLAQVNTGGRVVGIELRPAHVFEGMANLIDLKITWDGETTPAIYAPVADFFGFAFGSKSMKSLLMGVDSTDRAYCFIPMPFDKNATIELVYRKHGDLKKLAMVDAKITYATTKRNPVTEGRFYVNWKRDVPALGTPYVFLAGAGKGHYVGTVLQSQGKTYTEFTEFFEGDDSTVIDGANTLHGTGSEDYFNGGWYAQAGGWVERRGSALHGCLDYSLPLSRTGGYRFYVSDKLPFNRTIYHSIEHGPERNNRAVEYTSLAFYYADKPVQNTSVPTDATSQVFTPDTLTFYARLMDHLTYNGTMQLKDGNAVLPAQQEGQTNVNVAELKPGTYQVHLNLVASDTATSEVQVQSSIAGNGSWNKLISGPKKNNFYYITEVEIENTKAPLQLRFKSNNAAVILHRVMLVKKS